MHAGHARFLVRENGFPYYTFSREVGRPYEEILRLAEWLNSARNPASFEWSGWTPPHALSITRGVRDLNYEEDLRRAEAA